MTVMVDVVRLTSCTKQDDNNVNGEDCNASKLVAQNPTQMRQYVRVT
jgi:hypothetical protein